MYVGVIAWVRKGVFGWGSLDCCRKMCVWGVGERGEVECVCDCLGVGVIVWGCVENAWVWKGACGGAAIIAAVKYVCDWGTGEGEREVCVWMCMWVRLWGCGCEEECVGGAALITAVKYVCVVGREGEGECVYGCDCGGMSVIVCGCEGVDVTVWACVRV